MRAITGRVQGEFGCGSTALSMILQSYGEAVSESDIISAIGGIGPIDQEGNPGTLVTDNALFARRLGYPVTCYTNNIRLHLSNYAEFDQVDLYWYLDSIRHNYSGMDRRVLDTYLSLIEEGASLIIQPASPQPIHYHLDRDIPPIINLDQMLFHEGHAFTGLGHSIVACGRSPNLISYIDPEDGKQHSANENLLLSAMGYYSLNHSSYLVAVEPKILIQ